MGVGGPREQGRKMIPVPGPSDKSTHNCVPGQQVLIPSLKPVAKISGDWTRTAVDPRIVMKVSANITSVI